MLAQPWLGPCALAFGTRRIGRELGLAKGALRDVDLRAEQLLAGREPGANGRLNWMLRRAIRALLDETGAP